jgi:hypothetical protein
MNHYKYRLSDGAIVEWGSNSAPGASIPTADGAHGVLEVAALRDRQYVDVSSSPVVVRDQEPLGASWDTMTITAGSGVATLSPVPTGCRFMVAGQEVEVSDGSLEVEADLVGTYQVRLISPQYIRQTWTIEAT